MLEVHKLPTAEVFTATLKEMHAGSYGADQSLSAVVMYEMNTDLGGVPSVKNFIQISSSVKADKPAHNSIITIANVSYKLINPITRKNPGFVTFYESEIQKTQ